MTALGVARILPVPKLCVHLSLNNHLVNTLSIPDVLLSRAAITNYHKLGGLKQTEICYPTVLQARNLKSRFCPGWFFQEVLRKNQVRASLSWLLVAAGNPQGSLLWLHHSSLASVLTGPARLCLCASLLFLSLVRTLIIGFRATLIQVA